MPDGPSDDRRLDDVLNIITTLSRLSIAGGYIFRGEPKHYDRVASRLYRDYADMGSFDVAHIQRQMLEEAKDYTDETEESILTQIQHYGGSTNLIDFTTDYLVSLFFACDGHPDAEGRVILLEVSQEMIDREYIWAPRTPVNRVVAQKSIFVEHPLGFVEPDAVVNIPHGLKVFVLEYLSSCHDISAISIYNDLHGFIRYRALHHDSLADFSAGLTCEQSGDYQGAVDYYTKSLDRNPRFAIAYNNRGVAYHRKGDYQRAIQDYTSAIGLNPDYADAYCNRGEAWLHLGEWEQARADFNVALSKGADIAGSFLEEYENVAAFEQRHGLQLPPDIAEMLGG